MTTTTAFAFERLPSLPRAAGPRGRALARAISALDGARAFTARGLGRVTVEVERVDLAPAPGAPPPSPSPETTFTLLRHDGSSGTVSFDRPFALALVRVALGAATPPVARPLSPSERGVLAAVLASLVASATSGAIRLGLDRPPPPDDDHVSVTLSIRTSALAGSVVLQVPVAWLPSETRALPPHTPWLLTTTLVVEAARTFLPATTWAAAEPGDAVVFGGVSPLDDDLPWPCSLRVGAHAAEAIIIPDGELCLQSPFTTGHAHPETPMSDDDDITGSRPPEPHAPLGQDAAAVLAGAPVEVVAELARLTLRGDEVVGLTSGTVLTLGPRRRDIVTLRVGGRLWARGELVNVDNELGVRITEILKPR